MFQSVVFDDEGRFVCLQPFLPAPLDPEVEAVFDLPEEDFLALSGIRDLQGQEGGGGEAQAPPSNPNPSPSLSPSTSTHRDDGPGK
ncbi:hypothetical protein ColKHC_10486 [Colletotrichum higginsianum]|nr:hypothetical protein ColKHC_10486 [Colletotrichum higginsianum]